MVLGSTYRGYTVLCQKAECLTRSRYRICTKNGKLLSFQDSRLMLKILVFNHLIICLPIQFNLCSVSSFQLSWLRDWVSRTSEHNHCKIFSHIPQDLPFSPKPYKHSKLHEVLATDKYGANQGSVTSGISPDTGSLYLREDNDGQWGGEEKQRKTSLFFFRISS